MLTALLGGWPSEPYFASNSFGGEEDNGHETYTSTKQPYWLLPRRHAACTAPCRAGRRPHTHGQQDGSLLVGYHTVHTFTRQVGRSRSTHGCMSDSGCAGPSTLPRKRSTQCCARSTRKSEQGACTQQRRVWQLACADTARTVTTACRNRTLESTLCRAGANPAP